MNESSFKYEGGYYDLLNDIDKETIMNDILDWIDDHMSEAHKVSLKKSAKAG